MLNLVVATMLSFNGPTGPSDIIRAPIGSNGSCEAFALPRKNVIEAVCYAVVCIQAYFVEEEKFKPTLFSVLLEVYDELDELGFLISARENDLIVERLNEIQVYGYQPRFEAPIDVNKLPKFKSDNKVNHKLRK